MLIANTDIEAKQLIDLYDADPGRVEVVHPGVDLDGVPAARHGRRPRRGSACRADAHVLLFAGRIQPLKAPDVLLRAVAALLEPRPGAALAARRPGRRRPVRLRPRAPRVAGRSWPTELGIDDVVRFVPPVAQAELADWYAAATLVAVPSYNESFGLVAVEAQATGTPVVAAAVGGLTTVVRDGAQRPAGRRPRARRLGRRAAAGRSTTPTCGARLSRRRAARRPRRFAWERTAERTLEVYERAARSLRDDRAWRAA